MSESTKKHPLSRFLLLVFLPLSQKRREKHSYNFKCGCSREKKNLWFSCTFINFKEEMYVHMQAWNTVNKHSNIMSCAGLMLHTTRVQKGWEERKKQITPIKEWRHDIRRNIPFLVNKSNTQVWILRHQFSSQRARCSRHKGKTTFLSHPS